jgi:simple sugar transport system permease protein
VLPFGFVLGLIAAGLLWSLYRSTIFGFQARILGDSPPAARYAGVKTRRVVVVMMALSGALAGIGGASEVGDFRHLLDARGLQQVGLGYTGIVVAALARYNPFAVVLVAFLLGGLTNAGYSLQGPGFPAGLVGVLQGMILFFALGGELLLHYRISFTRRIVVLSGVATTS